VPRRRRSPAREFEEELGALLRDITRLGPRAALAVPVRLLREIERALSGGGE